MKNVVLVVIVLALLAGAGYYFYATRSGSTQQTQNGTVKQPEQEKPGMFTSIKDALSKSLSLKCEFKSEQGIATTTYIKGGAVRVETVSKDPSQPGTIIMKDQKMYMWSDSTKKGFVYTLQTPKDISPPAVTGGMMQKEPGATSGNEGKQADVLAMVEKFKDSCKPTTVSDSMFSPPSDVQFQDFDSMMKGIAPSGSQTGGSGDYQKYLEMMKKAPTGN